MANYAIMLLKCQIVFTDICESRLPHCYKDICDSILSNCFTDICEMWARRTNGSIQKTRQLWFQIIERNHGPFKVLWKIVFIWSVTRKAAYAYYSCKQVYDYFRKTPLILLICDEYVTKLHYAHRSPDSASNISN